MKTADAFQSDFIRDNKLEAPVFVTQPTMPDLKDYTKLLERIWDSKWLTNNGAFHEELEARLRDYFGVEHINLFCNGTIGLLVALQALRINGGEVITTPFTFPATPHVLYWNRITPVFCDIDPETFNLDPACIERLIGPDTKAIMPVHVYGTPCDVDAIQAIADVHGLQVIYDAAHTFGARYRGKALCDYGDMAMLSFHATKLFSTLEGGALVVRSEAERQRINYLKNFGFAGQESVIGPGINGKMNELQAAYGLLELDIVGGEIERRRAISAAYRRGLEGIPGITLLCDMPELERNHAYFPILIDPERFGMDRNAVFDTLKACNVFTRKYFFPLCSSYPCYSALPSARPEMLPVANRVADQVLCLPTFGELELGVVEFICGALRAFHEAAAPAR